MSEVISHIADPLVEEFAETRAETEQIIMLTTAAWNIALQPDEQREEQQIRLAKKLLRRRLFGVIPWPPTQESIDFFRYLCEVVACRKQKYYPRLNHLILDVQFQPVEEGVYFEVMYAMDWQTA